jgi:tyrosyl-tRNA synthetase
LISRLLSLEERFQLVRSVGEECIQEDELRNLLEKKPLPICYDGFEPSGRMHIAQVYSFLLFQSSFYFVPRVFCC